MCVLARSGLLTPDLRFSPPLLPRCTLTLLGSSCLMLILPPSPHTLLISRIPAHLIPNTRIRYTHSPLLLRRVTVVTTAVTAIGVVTTMAAAIENMMATNVTVTKTETETENETENVFAGMTVANVTATEAVTAIVAVRRTEAVTANVAVGRTEAMSVTELVTETEALTVTVTPTAVTAITAPVSATGATVAARAEAQGAERARGAACSQPYHMLSFVHVLGFVQVPLPFLEVA